MSSFAVHAQDITILSVQNTALKTAVETANMCWQKQAGNEVLVCH